ncbi:MAG: hypothetical protein Q7T20_15710 [Saprospiraceae bacterium]|nr:hypothetical protein [Saprospiraceae bacterium]
MEPIKIFALSVLLASAFLVTCKNDPKQAANSVDQETTLPTPPPSPKPEIYLFAVSVDKLNLREQSNKNGKVITQFAEGEFVEGAGEISANKEEVTLRNIPYNEPYLKVTSTTPEQHKGWAYSAGLVPVYAGPRATSPDLGKLVQFTTFLKKLNVKKLDSGKKAWDYVSLNLGNAQGTLADATFILLERFLFRMEIEGNFYEMTEKIKWQDSDYIAIQEEKFDLQKYPATKQIAENGFRLEVGEGMVFPVVDWSKFGAFFAGKMTPAMKSYLKQTIAEHKDQMWSDGGIIIPLEQVADRAAWWEKFNKANPYFVLSEETQNTQQSLIFMLICGADNTPVFAGETDPVSEDFKKAWAYIQQKYAGTELERSTREMANLVTAEGGKRTKKVEALMQKYMTE